jgi:hypothetical protein
VITIGADGSDHGVWREMPRPPSLICIDGAMCRKSSIVEEMKCVVVDGVVHFLIYPEFSYLHSSFERGSIASFNLETEEWMPTLRGPSPVRTFVTDLSLSNLCGCLVTVHNIRYTFMDLWFLSDFEKGLWVKKYSLPSQVARPRVYPLLVLDDERILFMHGQTPDSLVRFRLETGI